MKKQLFIAAIAALSGSTSAFAGGDSLFGGSSTPSSGGVGTMYGGGSIGKTTDGKCGTANTNCKGSGWKLFGGYKLMDNIAVEGGYYDLVNTNDAKATGVGVAGVASVPVADNLELFGKGGAMKWKSDSTPAGATATSNKGTDLLLGVGASYKMGDNWGLRTEYENVGGNLKANLYSVGATFSTL